jgi:serine/threonine-protein kinase
MNDLSSKLDGALTGRYSIVEELGRGSMSRVFRATDLKHKRDVAIKVLQPEISISLAAERFLREIEIVSGLLHPHVLPLYDSGDADGLLYHITPLFDGETIRDRLERDRQFPVDEALQLAREVADGLDYAHEQDVIHRDIKPENILLYKGHALIADFGLARAVTIGGGERLTQTGFVVGSPAYMSPEQARGEDTIDGRSDQYGLACVLYEMLAGEPPLSGRTRQVIVARRLSEKPSPIHTIRDSVSPAVDQILAKALSRLPADRFATSGEFAEALSAAETGSILIVSNPGTMDGASVPATSMSTSAITSAVEQLVPDFWYELKRRKVYSVGIVYGAFMIASIGLVSDLGELVLSAKVVNWLLILLAAGLPISLVLAWVFEIKPEGVTRTQSIDIREETGEHPVSRRAALVAGAILVIAFAGWIATVLI